ncbi:hypothetical protein NW759_016601 [Fusarium solani]|nr:hypothetical protein NW759_016601 [Fusarium solani]
MPLNLQFNVDGAVVGRDDNDWVHYDQHNDSDDDSFNETFDKYNKFGLLNTAMRAAGIASEAKGRIASTLTNLGVRAPRIKRNDEGKCEACGDMDRFMTYLHELDMSTKAECPSCGILAEGVRRYVKDKKALGSGRLAVAEDWNGGCAGRQFVRTKLRTATMPGALGVSVLLSGEGDVRHLFTDWRQVPSEVVCELNFFGVEGSPASWDTVGLAAEISGDTSSDAAFGWFLNRLNHCVQKHGLCNVSDGTQLPPRVLDLGPPGTTELDADIKLMPVLGEKDLYVCLSYCWGGTINIRLLRDRYHDYLRKIPWDILPQGYRDAIHLTRKLGIRYIWIDSLCIVQDDEDDWRKQASLMAQIFQNAYVTIAGTKSQNPNDGYFSVGPPKYKATRIEHEAQDGTVRHAYVRQTIPHFFSTEGSHQSDYTPGNFPLLTRGWVFQERLLSPRILHLGDVEMAWECNEVCACECIGETKTYESEPRWAHTKGGHTRNLAAAEDEKDVQPEWRSTVEHYTRTKLTYRKDIFPAISGVVKNMKRYRSDRYLAGVWESSVLEDLAWLVVGKAKARPTEWIAPTWSWASVAGPVSYPNKRTILSKKYIQETEPLKHRTMFVEASVTPVRDDDTAELTAAQMVLFGPMISATLIADPETLDKKQLYLAVHEHTGLVFAPDYDLVAEGPSCMPLGSTIYILHLCEEPKFKDENRRDTSRKTFALVLRRIHDKDGADTPTVPLSDGPRDGTYERIGIVIQGPDKDVSEVYVAAHGIDCVVKLI